MKRVTIFMVLVGSAAFTASRGGAPASMALRAKKAKKPASAGGFGAAAPKPAPKKPVAKDDGPALARPWDETDGDDGEQTRMQRRGGKGKIGKKTEGGAAPQPSGGMAAGTKLK